MSETLNDYIRRIKTFSTFHGRLHRDLMRDHRRKLASQAWGMPSGLRLLQNDLCAVQRPQPLVELSLHASSHSLLWNIAALLGRRQRGAGYTRQGGRWGQQSQTTFLTAATQECQ